ncbi:MAG: hypothetical protein ACYTEX_26455 [Planctomycetota bacterium]
MFDKSVFQGTSRDRVCEFARTHTLVVPYVLLVECLISKDRDSSDLLKRIQQLIKAGAHYGQSPFKLCEEEKKTVSPVDSIIDQQGTKRIVTGALNDEKDYFEKEAATYWQNLAPIVRTLLNVGEAFYSNISKMDLLAGMRKEDMTNRGGRWKQWVQAVNESQGRFVHEIRPLIASHLTSDWYTWHDTRLRSALAMEWAYKKAKSGELPRISKASHDFHDMQYGTYLSRADGLLTRDGKLMKPLAEAAFPDKDVFSSLDEVPAEYRRHRG